MHGSDISDSCIALFGLHIPFAFYCTATLGDVRHLLYSDMYRYSTPPSLLTSLPFSSHSHRRCRSKDIYARSYSLSSSPSAGPWGSVVIRVHGILLRLYNVYHR